MSKRTPPFAIAPAVRDVGLLHFVAAVLAVRGNFFLMMDSDERGYDLVFSVG